jgi:hypothetical protein
VIDLSRLRAPGWQRIVADLTAGAAGDEAFLSRLAAATAQAASARTSALFAVDGAPDGEHAEPRLLFAYPAPEGPRDAPSEPEHAAEMRSAASAALASGHARLFGLGDDDGMYATRGGDCIIAAPLPPIQSGVRHVLVLLVEQRSQQAIQTTLAIVELLAGYAHAHAARQQLRRARAGSAAMELATRLVAGINSAPGFRGAAMQLCNDLARQLAADRVAMGWVRGVGESGDTHVVAISDTEHVDRRLAMVRRLQHAMDECFDQARAVAYPPPPVPGTEPDAVLLGAIAHAHRELASGDARLKVASLPLRVEDRVLGVVTIESSADGIIEPATLALLQAALDLIAPLLRLWRSDDRYLPVRAADSALKAAAWSVGARHTGWKLALLALLALAAIVVFVQAPYRVDGAAVLEPRAKRVVSAPFDGRIVELAPGIEPGADVVQGQLLARLDDTEQRLALLEIQASIEEAMRKAEASLQAGQLAEHEQSRLRARQGEARRALYEEQIAQSRLVAPIDGRIVAGDLRERVGASVSLGQALFEVAQLDDMVVVARVPDRDIKLVQDLLDGGEEVRGRLATKALPASPIPLVVERVIPLATPKEGVNAFEVRARIDAPPSWLRPGMEGVVKLDTGRRSLLSIGTRRIIDTLRLWLWW